jgi:N6-adenosine-specific RNA methylase IME4
VSGRTLEKVAAVCDAARSEPDKYGALVAAMDEGRRIDNVYLRLVAARHEEARAETIAHGCTVADLASLIAAGKRFAAICPDPPWEWKTWGPGGGGRSTKRHYGVSGLADIKALPVQALAADDCALFLWMIESMLLEALEVIAAWGFKHKTTAFTWIKTTATAEVVTLAGDGLHWGNGFYTRGNPEVCLLATRGSPRTLNHDVHQVIVSPVGRHSEKPDEAYARIARLVAGPYLELYARKERPGWTVWGNEIERARFADALISERQASDSRPSPAADRVD